MSFARLPLRSLPRVIIKPTPILSSSSSSILSLVPAASRCLHVSPRCAEQRQEEDLAKTIKKVSMSSISAIRKAVPGTSMIKAKESLLATFNAVTGQEDLSAALTWLEEDRQKTGAKRAEKVALREAKEGMVGICVLADGLGVPVSSSPKSTMPTSPPRAGLVELNCETDFVARNEVFNRLVQDLSHTAALFPELALSQSQTSTPAQGYDSQPHLIDLPLQEFLNFPFLSSSPDATRSSARPRTVHDAIVDLVSRLGEKITLARASSISTLLPLPATDPRRSDSIDETYIVSSFAHGGVNSPPSQGQAAFSISAGRVASLVLTKIRGLSGNAASPVASEEMIKTIRGLGRSLARQTAGMQTTRIRDDPTLMPTAEGQQEQSSTTLYSQPFLMLLPSAGLSSRITPLPEGENVQSALERWCEEKGVQHVEVTEIRRWTLGETAIIAEAAQTRDE